MKFEFLATGADECPLVRLFDYRPEDVDRLRQAARDLADRRICEFALHDQPWIQSVDGCQFVWRSADKEVGVKRPRQGEPFVMALTDEAWREVEGKLEPFIMGSGGFNWLTAKGPVKVLISADGRW